MKMLQLLNKLISQLGTFRVSTKKWLWSTEVKCKRQTHLFWINTGLRLVLPALSSQSSSSYQAQLIISGTCSGSSINVQYSRRHLLQALASGSTTTSTNIHLMMRSKKKICIKLRLSTAQIPETWALARTSHSTRTIKTSILAWPPVRCSRGTSPTTKLFIWRARTYQVLKSRTSAKSLGCTTRMTTPSLALSNTSKTGSMNSTWAS